LKCHVSGNPGLEQDQPGPESLVSVLAALDIGIYGLFKPDTQGEDAKLQPLTKTVG